jgi:hypothetical protein
VIAIREKRFAHARVFYRRHPEVGDTGTILEVYSAPELAYEVECSDPADGSTIWLAAMYPDELELAVGTGR